VPDWRRRNSGGQRRPDYVLSFPLFLFLFFFFFLRRQRFNNPGQISFNKSDGVVFCLTWPPLSFPPSKKGKLDCVKGLQTKASPFAFLRTRNISTYRASLSFFFPPHIFVNSGLRYATGSPDGLKAPTRRPLLPVLSFSFFSFFFLQSGRQARI